MSTEIGDLLLKIENKSMDILFGVKPNNSKSQYKQKDSFYVNFNNCTHRS